MNAPPIDTATERIVTLRAEQVARVNGAARLHIARGLLWLTVDGQPDDHWLGAGEHFTLGRGARAWVQAMRAPASVVVAEAPSWPQRAAGALQAATQCLAGVLP